MEAGIDTVGPSLDVVSVDARTEIVGDAAPPPGGEAPKLLALLDKGDTLGRYVVLRRLGAGAMGTVYLGYDPELDRRVALKLLRGLSSEGRAQALRREAQAMAKLSHE